MRARTGRPPSRFASETTVWMHAPLGKRTLLSKTAEDRVDGVDRRTALPSIHNGSVYYGTSRASGEGQIVRYRIAAGRRRRTPLTALRPASPFFESFGLLSVAASEADIFYSGSAEGLRPDCGRPSEPCRVRRPLDHSAVMFCRRAR